MTQAQWQSDTGSYNPFQLITAGSAAYIWNVVTAAGIAKFFWVGVVQSRLAAVFNDEGMGLVTAVFAALLVGAMPLLAMGLRMGEASLGERLLQTIPVFMLTGSAFAFMYGFIWLRTRNLVLIILIAATSGISRDFHRIGEYLGLL